MNSVDRAAAIIAEEWGTFSALDLCGHEIGIARALRRAGLLMPDGMNTQTETVCIEFPDGTTLYGTVTAESAEVDGHVRVVTKTVRVHPGGSMTTTGRAEHQALEAADAVD